MRSKNSISRFTSDRQEASRALSGLVAALVLACAWTSAASGMETPFGEEFDPYRIILTRLPFGEEPPPPPPPPPQPPPPPPPARPEESFARDLRLTFIVRSDAGDVRVGIINERSKETFFMEIGDVENDMRLVSVDYQEERVLLRHGEQEAWLSMRGQALDTGRAGSMAPPAAAPAPAARPSVASRYRRPAAAARPAMTREEYERTRTAAPRPPPRPPRAVLTQTEGDDGAGIVPPEHLTPEEREKWLRQYNLELIRGGGELGPPLPIELTREEDDQLVEEGVLPPME